MGYKIMRFGLYFLIAFMFIISSSYTGHAEIRLDPAVINFAIQDAGVYNSNPGYADKGNEDSDWGNIVTGFYDVEIPFGELHRYTLSGVSSWTQYFGNNDFSHVDNTFSHSVDLTFNKWLVNIHHRFDNTSEPTTEETPIVSDSMMTKFANYPGITIQGDLGKMKLTTGFDYTNYRVNKQYKVLDRDAYKAYLDTAYIITPRLDGFVRGSYTYTKRLSSVMNSSNGFDVTGGLRGELTPYLVGEIGAGYGFIDFDTRNNNIGTENYSNFIASGSITNRLFKHTTQKASFSIAPQQGYNVGNYFQTYIARYGIIHKLNKMINLKSNFEFIRAEESGDNHFRELASIWKSSAGIDVNIIKNLNLTAGYAFSYKDSNRHGRNYKQHVVSAGSRYEF